MNSFKCSWLADRAELKAIVFAVATCFVFIGFIVAVHRSRNVTATTRIHISPPPLPAPRITERPADMNQMFRIVPSNFRAIDFENRSYGDYRSSNGAKRELVLSNGAFREFGDSSQWFNLNDVFYTDLTGDGVPEAIVMMTHVECSPTCDAGKNLLYVYSQMYVYSQNDGLKEVLKYESGSGMAGCSIKSLTVKNGRMALELFGRCPNPEPSSILDIRETYDLTRVEFSFNGTKLVEKGKTFLRVPNLHEVNYGVDVRITDNRTPQSHEL
jgi:hypothetical protein